MSKFNARRKAPRSKKRLVKPVKKPKLPTKLMNSKLEKNLEGNKVVFRESKYHKKVQSKIRGIIRKESDSPNV